ncbi:hypothetical protein C8R43DRAFT_1143550 [Mycena crocata]|nr:hypothetical protein C8R43DRAFT_1143550 [Mycena crocata]
MALLPNPAALTQVEPTALCNDADTRAKAYLILSAARAVIPYDTGFDSGAHQTAMEAVCALLASQSLKNNTVTLQAAQTTSCQSLTEFKMFRNEVARALQVQQRPRRTRLTYESLLQHARPLVASQAVPLMEKVELVLLQALDQRDANDSTSPQEKICAIFLHVSSLIQGQPPVLPQSFQCTHGLHTPQMRELRRLIATACMGEIDSTICKEYPLSSVSSARKDPVKTSLRTLPSRGISGRDPPPAIRKITPSFVLGRDMYAQGSPISIATSSSSHPLTAGVARFRRFRPVFLDQHQWERGNPRVPALTAAAQQWHNVLVQRYGPPFQQSTENNAILL